MSGHIVVLPGDGIGPEVIGQSRRVLDWFAEFRGFDVTVREDFFDAAAYARYGAVIRDEVRADAMVADAVLFGATGGPEYDKIPAELRRKDSLLRLRRDMEIFINLRPVIGYEALAQSSPLKPEVMRGVDFVVVRELNGGIYFGEPRGIEDLADGSQRGVNTQVYTTPEIERIARAAFELAGRRSGRLCSADKANVLESSRLWRQVVSRVGAEEYPEIDLSHIFVDNCAMQIVRDPKQFDVLLADNMFGDILSDCGGAVSGSLGMLPSASLSAPGADGRRRALYEPVHGSAPDIAGRGIANPLAAILSFAMALELSFERDGDAELLRRAVRQALDGGARTADIRAPNRPAVSTVEMGDAVIRELDKLKAEQTAV